MNSAPILKFLEPQAHPDPGHNMPGKTEKKDAEERACACKTGNNVQLQSSNLAVEDFVVELVLVLAALLGRVRDVVLDVVHGVCAARSAQDHEMRFLQLVFTKWLPFHLHLSHSHGHTHPQERQVDVQVKY